MVGRAPAGVIVRNGGLGPHPASSQGRQGLGLNRELRSPHPASTLYWMPEPAIERAEVVALLFNVSDIAVTLTNIERVLGGDDGEEEADEG
jgi:hypothetical protein